MGEVDKNIPATGNCMCKTMEVSTALVLVLKSKILKQDCGMIKEVLLQGLLHLESWSGFGVGFRCIPGGSGEAGR